MSLTRNTSPIFRPISSQRRDETQNESRLDNQAPINNFNIHY